MLYITNAFSINMLESEDSATVDIVALSLEETQTYINDYLEEQYPLQCAIGHEDLAQIVSKQLGILFEAERLTITLKEKDILIVAQYRGPRLPEGSTGLPPEAKIQYYIITRRIKKESTE